MSWRDERDGERAAWSGPRHDREHEDRMERARYAYTYGDPDRAYRRGYEEELERQERERVRREREDAEAMERRRREFERQYEMSMLASGEVEE